MLGFVGGWNALADLSGRDLQTKKGWLGVTTVTPAQWRAFCEMLGLTALRDDPTLFMGVDRLQHVEAIERQFIPKLKQRTAQEWFAEGLRRKVPIVPVPEIGDRSQTKRRKRVVRSFRS